MLKNSIVSKIAATKVMAVVRINTRERAIEIVEGLLAGGVDVMEISYNSDNASDHIRFICKNYPDMLVGAGTVLDSETARMAIDAGAKFIIAPTFSKDVAKLCNRYQIPYCLNVKAEFKKKFDELDRVLSKKLAELTAFIKDSQDMEKKIAESQRKLAWLEEIQTKTKAILDI